MKDYGNAGALCGALGCMVLLVISMYFANKEEPETKSASAEMSQTAEEVSGTAPAQTTEAVSGTEITGTEITGTDIIDTDAAGMETEMPEETAAITEFVGPFSKEAMATMTTEPITVDLPQEVLHELYAENLSIVGDSIASGFGAYQVLMNPYNFAVTNLSVTTINDYSFDYDGQTLSYIGALSAAQPGYIYLSMGMNDMYMTDAAGFAENYMGIIDAVRETCPDSVIIVAGVSPIAVYSSYVPGSTINEFNSALQSAVESAAYDRVFYYDTAAILADPSTGGLMSEYDGGDGIHLSATAYSMLLENVCLMLDEISMPPSVLEQAQELAGTASETVTETVAEQDSETEIPDTAESETEAQ